MRPLFHLSIEEVTVEGILHALSDPIRVAIYADIVAQGACQGRSKTRPVWRSKSRPVDSRWLLWDFGVEGRWSVAEAALLPRGALGIGSSVLRMGFVCGGSA